MFYLNTIPGFLEIIQKEREIKDENERETKDENETNQYHICHKKHTSQTQQQYTLLWYDKNVLLHDLISTRGLLRSVVIKENKVMSFAPPKSMSWDSFKILPHLQQDLQIELFVEGIMINMFWDESIGLHGGWEIASKYNIECLELIPNTNKTLRELFLETLTLLQFQLSHLYPNYCYSFVFQHPLCCNHYMIPFLCPMIYLVEVYEIRNIPHINKNHINESALKTTKELENLIVVIPQKRDFLQKCIQHSFVKLPSLFLYLPFHELELHYGSLNTPYYIEGIVVKDTLLGRRTKKRNPISSIFSQLNDITAKHQFQYLVLRQQGKTKEYLTLFPHKKKEWNVFRQWLHHYTNTLFQNYQDYYVKKKSKLYYFPKEYQYHMKQLHQIYLNDLREKKEAITQKKVINYINNMLPTQQMYYMNLFLRKRAIDFHSVYHIATYPTFKFY